MAKTTKKKVKKSRKEHGNSTWDPKKWDAFIECIKVDVEFETSCDYVEIPTSTINDWMKRDKELSDEYKRAQKHMDVITSNTLSHSITREYNEDIMSESDKAKIQFDKAKRAVEWKKRRDKRYKDKGELTGKDDAPLIDNINITISKE